ncbi:MAG: hypothetical protein KF871_12395 [Hydrogenophaga sp.]|uniref:hypothetical protein n=1 Tax=Hydrogenophaga sp. TaxID=1904254 RepID=UPI001DF23079|nr:hypothetical protein [Hydrogenophaga sp.]MBX3610686.1 hypothetical protein [Hydrogenophaga sp.]
MPPDLRFTHWRLACALLLGTLGTACAVTPAEAPPPARAAGATVAASTLLSGAPASPPDAAPPPATVAVAPVLVNAAASEVSEADANSALLRYGERVRALTPPELTLEIASLGDPGMQAPRQLQLAMALMQSGQPVDTARALGLAQRVAANGAPEVTPYRPFARLLAARLMEQRRLEEALDRQAQQLRDQQRRIDQLNDRLEAMRAIERSLNNRAPAAAPRPATP